VFTALVAVVALVLLVLQHSLDERRYRGTLNMERARQDQLLNRLASRNLTEYVAVKQAEVFAATVPEGPKAEPMRYLYDETGLQRIEAPMDLEDEAYEKAGSM
jgi:hypothetical protein